MRTTGTSVMKTLLAVTAVVGVLCGSGSAQAEPATHDGFYLQLNAGLGYMSASVEQGGQTANLHGVTLPSSLLMGGTVGPVVIGGGIFTDHAFSPGYSVNGESVPINNVTMTLIGIGAFADIYPDVHKGLHFQPFVGWGGLERSVNGNSGGSDPTGLVLALGGGYDVFVSDNWSIGGMARIAYAPLKYDEASVGVIAPSLLATFTYH